MPNYNVFGNLREPVVYQDISAASAQNGVNYRITTGIVAVAANSYLAIQLDNPSSSRYTARIGRIFGGALSNTAVYLMRGGTIAGGITLQPVNTNFGFTNASQLIPTFTNTTGGAGSNPAVGSTTFSTIIQATGPIDNDEIGKIIVPPNTRLIVNLQSLAGGTNTLAITIGWAEVSPVS
ncbi:hypothetical protein [Fictibacillus phosphorivorans]|uniref:hypothetical protein n=1 Tax=Fictibacillus phosphorivorans TaxID=1221500 RepID=UPI0011A80CC7|nr:hypothetical protein [Fictibacillus phosphorivorans]